MPFSERITQSTLLARSRPREATRIHHAAPPLRIRRRRGPAAVRDPVRVAAPCRRRSDALASVPLTRPDPVRPPTLTETPPGLLPDSVRSFGSAAVSTPVRTRCLYSPPDTETPVKWRFRTSVYWHQRNPRSHQLSFRIRPSGRYG